MNGGRLVVDEDGWCVVARVGDIEPDDVIQVKLEKTCVAVFNLSGRYYATSDVCTHAQAFLSSGYIQDDTVECPLHQGVFHIPTGKALAPPVTEALRTYPLRIEDGRIAIKLR